MILFHDEIRKAMPDYPEAIQRLRGYLEKKQPDLVNFFARFWKDQQNAITYPEIRQALLTGQIDKATFDAWVQDYSRFITDRLQPLWQDAMDNAAQTISDKRDGFMFDLNTQKVREWTQNHSAELITKITEDQRGAINALIQRASVIQDIGVDALARAIRPTIGLYPAQAAANFNYFQTVKNTFQEANPHMKPETAARKATESAIKYSEKQQRYRAEMISRTELAAAYNNGERLAINQAVSQGYMLSPKKQWMSAGDGRVCARCQAFEDSEPIDIDELFREKGTDKTWDVPPLHPHCRCVCIYQE
jgi:hypothetical protein